MDEYEVDLRDYIRVVWWGKWIILGVVVVAVGLAAVVTMRSPDVYRAEVLLAVGRPMGVPNTYTPPTTDLLAERVQDRELLERAAAEGVVSASWLMGSVTARKQDSFAQITIQGSLPPHDLAGAAGRVVAALQEEAAAELVASIVLRLSEVQSEREALLLQVGDWETELARSRAWAEARRDQLRSRIAELQVNPEVLGLSVGDGATIRGYLVQKELDLLYARLQATEQALDEMDRLGSAYVVGLQEQMALRNQLATLDQEEAALRDLLSIPPQPVVVVRGPTVSGPLGTSLKMNVAVAGVIGLFVGVLLVFFVHWLRFEPQGGDKTGSTRADSGQPRGG
ncbi:MAG: Wzz/FepE/Etk N-terminal domain-containing protein [Candidatus Bipolaricaulis sp.]|nr:Wzz/FepE/Etk N-terminal domain-containing protein [Candidatus Bipolaricaulis sp.]